MALYNTMETSFFLKSGETMLSKDELRVIQKRLLTQLKMVHKGYISIENAMKMTEAEMEAEDVAYVNEKITEVVVMEQEDIAHCEKTIGVKAL